MKTYKRTRKWPKYILAAVIAVLVVSIGWLGWHWYENYQAEQAAQEQAEREQAAREAEEAAAPELSLEERFVERYYDVLEDLPGVEPVTDPPDITGNQAADEYIRDLAEERGYRLQATPTRELEEVDGEQMQPETAEAWQELRDAASADGVSLEMVSAYRDIDTQAIIFDAALRERGEEAQGQPFSPEQIVDGEADEAIDDILSRSSIPGYSKHHTGHTIDVTDGAAGATLEEFGETEAFAWLAENDYANAREFGFLPSYPEGVDNLGPDPELWEFVWVGEDNVDFD